ncbi:hypothetical protein B0H17DRAFT_1192974 [Mycena rosella]|uniref:Protein YIF1 n=1 Tax=Mycena rosella TaxID=1033263 RepID=A0AAD7M895_MYCRO|nr:hypothetical protein B0H17DRAFT_1192974 [Mycena rosella]
MAPGSNGRGDALQVLGESASRALILVMLVQLGCYFLNVQGPSQSIDAYSGYNGYKFVRFLKLGGALSTITFLYFFAANGFFLLRSLRSLSSSTTPPRAASDPYATTPSASRRRRRIAFLLVEAASQAIWMGFLARI